MAEAVDYKQIGTSPVRPDGFDKVTGRAHPGRTKLPNMIYGKRYAVLTYARIKSADVSAALAMPGVYAAISGADFPGGRLDGELVVKVVVLWTMWPRMLWHATKCSITATRLAVAASTVRLAEQARGDQGRVRGFAPVLDVVSAMIPPRR